MAVTPRKFEWQTVQLLSSEAYATGDTVHYYTGEAQVLYLNDGFKYRDGEVPEGHWQEFTPGDEKQLQATQYEMIHVDHPDNGTLYIQALYRNEEYDTLYLLRYDYMRDISDYLLSGDFTLQSDNPITQLNLTLKNVKDSLFTEEHSLFLPSSRIIWNMSYGDSPAQQICETYLDEVNWNYGSPTVSLSARNNVGYYLSNQTFDTDLEYNTVPVNAVITLVLQRFGISKFIIQDSLMPISLKVKAEDTGLAVLQSVMNILSDATTAGETWDIEETYDGTIIIGNDSFRRQYVPRGNYAFDDVSKVFQKSITRTLDGAYGHVRATGKDSEGNDLSPVLETVETWPYWEVTNHRTYHAPALDGVSQAELEKYAKEIAAQLRLTGRIVSYQSPMKPQLVVGDVVEIPEQGVLGTITEIKHTFGERGFMTTFTLDSGGTIDVSASGTYTKAKGIKGNNRKKRITDFIAKK